MTSHTIMPTVFTKSSLFSIGIQSSILVNDLKEFKRLLTSEDESLSEEKRYALAYSACMGSPNKKFLHCLILDCNLKEDFAHSFYLTEEVKALLAQRQAEELNKELEAKEGKEKKPKV